MVEIRRLETRTNSYGTLWFTRHAKLPTVHCTAANICAHTMGPMNQCRLQRSSNANSRPLYNPRDLISWTVQLTDSLGIVPACIFFRTSFSRKMRPISTSRHGGRSRHDWDIVKKKKKRKGIISVFIVYCCVCLLKNQHAGKAECRWEAMFISILKSQLPRLVGRIYTHYSTVYCCIFKSLFTTDSKICSVAVGGLLRIKVKEP